MTPEWLSPGVGPELVLGTDTRLQCSVDWFHHLSLNANSLRVCVGIGALSLTAELERRLVDDCLYQLHAPMLEGLLVDSKIV